MINIQIDRMTCIACGACAETCYARVVFEMNEDGPAVVHPEKCRLCGQCIAVCPTDSIHHGEIPLEECPTINKEHLPSTDALVDAFRARRSCRNYKDRSVARDTIERLISTSRWIPTGENRQFLDWIVLDDPEKISELLRNVLDALKESIRTGRDASVFMGSLTIVDVDRLIDLAVNRKKRFFFNAPVVLAAYCDKGSVCAREESTYAAYNIALAAETLGLGTCHIGSIHILLEEFAHLQHEVMGVPEDKEIHTLLTLGYSAWEFLRMVPRRMPEIAWNP